MASLVSSLLGGSFLDGVSKVINSIRGKNPEDAAKLEQLKTQYETEFMQAQAELEKRRIEENVSLNQTASENIRAEITSPDWYVRRARATPVWIICLAIIINYGLIPIARMFTLRAQPLDLPQAFWYFAAFIVGGYVGSRIAGRALGGAGGEMSLLGLKLDSKGD